MKTKTLIFKDKTHNEITNLLTNHINNIINEYNITKIITNGHLAIAIIDMLGYENLTMVLDDNVNPYIHGKYNNVLCYADAHMSWVDNRIIFYVEDDIVFTSKVLLGDIIL